MMDGFRAFFGLAPRKAEEKPIEIVPPASPAYALARSLTNPETRGEWAKEWSGSGDFWRYTYRNEKRDIELTSTWTGFGSCLSTPFTLSRSEQRIVEEALAQFDKRERSIAEARALARLVADVSPEIEEVREGSNGQGKA